MLQEAKSANWTEEDLKRVCAEWQRELGLQNWEVGIGFGRYYRVVPNSDGDVEWDESHRYAKIQILHPDDRNPNVLTPQDIETTIVHELLHLHVLNLIPKVNDGYSSVAEETLICALAKSFTNLKRFYVEKTNDGDD